MEQLEALQKLYESISKGSELLQGIELDSIVGEQAQDIAELVRLRQAGREWDSDVCGRLVEMGDICQLTGHWNEAVSGYERVLKKSNDEKVISLVYNNLGLVYAKKGEWGKAIEFFKKSLETFEKVGDVNGMGRTYANICKLYLENSELQQAKENLEESIKLIRQDARPDYPNTMNWLALCYSKLAEQKKSMSVTYPGRHFALSVASEILNNTQMT